MTRISYVKHIFEIYQTYTKVVSYVWYMSAMSHTLVYLRDMTFIFLTYACLMNLKSDIPEITHKYSGLMYGI